MNTIPDNEQDVAWAEVGKAFTVLDDGIKERDSLRKEVELLRKLRDAVLSVCVILSDDTPEKPSMIYGHPDRDEWFNICLAAREARG